MTDSAGSSRRPRRAVVALIVIVAAVAVFEAILNSIFPSYPPGFATGDPADITLRDVYTYDDTYLRDAEGRPGGETLATACWPDMFNPPDRMVTRVFEFEFSGMPDDAIFAGELSPHPTGKPSYPLDFGGSRATEFGLPSGKGVFSTYISAPLTYRVPYIPYVKRWQRNVPVRKVDVTVSWWSGPRGPAQLSFTGPFSAGATANADSGAKGTLEVRSFFDLDGTWGTWCYLSGTWDRRMSEVFAYGRDGVRRGVRPRGGRYEWVAPCRAEAEFVVLNMSPGDISAITFGEKAHERTFHNIDIFSGSPPSGAASVYVEAVSKRLGIPAPESIQNFRSALNDPNSALKAVELIRGEHIIMAARSLDNVVTREWYDALPEEDRSRLHAALLAWTEAPDAHIRLAGAKLGLEVDFPAFCSKAVELLDVGGDEAK